MSVNCAVPIFILASGGAISVLNVLLCAPPLAFFNKGFWRQTVCEWLVVTPHTDWGRSTDCLFCR